LSPGDVAEEPHIAEIIERTRALLDDGGDWAAMKQGIVAKVTAHVLTSSPLYRSDGSMLQVASVPLPDGNVLLTYLDVTTPPGSNERCASATTRSRPPGA